MFAPLPQTKRRGGHIRLAAQRCWSFHEGPRLFSRRPRAVQSSPHPSGSPSEPPRCLKPLRAL